MTDGGLEFERRVAQFHGYLETMHHRSHAEAEGFCFMLFETSFSREGSVRPRKAARSPGRALVSVGGGAGAFTPDERSFLDALDAEMDEEYPFVRYVQFGFAEHRFFMDLPLLTLFDDEAAEITAGRNGFSWARRNAKPFASKKDIEAFDPLQKSYWYADERTAAEDAAFIFFEVWGFPANSRLYVSASSCHTFHKWESGEPFE